VSKGEERKQNKSSRYIGVCWDKSRSNWRVDLKRNKRNRCIGHFASEDAAVAYDCAAVQARGPGAKRNFPDGAIGELPETVGEQKKQNKSSRYIGVNWNKASSSREGACG
jgi:hypothetical protein